MHGRSTTTVGAATLAAARDLVSLTKPRVTALVLLTAGGGLWLAPGRAGPWLSALFVVATAAVVGSANALNCWMERDSDRLMERTRHRPLPDGRLSPRLALAFGLGLGAAALPALALAANPLTALLGAIALVGYVWLYTPLKRVSPVALYVGAVPGAMPPLMGWTAVTGRIDAVGLTLFAILFAWQIPHFLAIALFNSEDYRRAELRVFPLVVGALGARRRVLGWSIVLGAVSLLPAALGVAGSGYLAVAATLGVGLTGFAAAGLRPSAGPRWARRFFVATLVHLTVLVGALVAGFGGP